MKYLLHADRDEIKELLLCGDFGLEKESLRIDGEGYLVHTEHPFPEDKHIVRDFSEDQVEINTPVFPSAKEAIASLNGIYKRVQKTLSELPDREYLWPFSSPPYIRNEDDIPIANFEGSETEKTEYREYLSDRYGRYKMTFSGIHVNYSFNEEMLQRDFALSGEKDFQEYKNQLYLTLAERVAAYGWLLVAITAASPLLDGSFVEKKQYDEDVFNGMASVRCSEMGYWNFFAPIFDYSDIYSYADSIQKYVDEGFLRAPSELYYPVRLKPAGKNDLNILKEKGVNHIELRMVDLNPLVPWGIEEKDLLFIQLFLVWLASTERQEFSRKAQVEAVQNFKSAARYDLKTVKIVVPNGEIYTVVDAAFNVLSFMREFYKDFPKEVHQILDFEEEKFRDPEKRYSWQVRKQYEDSFVKKGVQLAKQRQEEALKETSYV